MKWQPEQIQNITEILDEMAAGKRNEIGDYWSPKWAGEGADIIRDLQGKLERIAKIVDFDQSLLVYSCVAEEVGDIIND